jgi:hypothetical protein
VAFLLSLLGWAFKESHAPVREEVGRMGLALGQALYYGGFVSALYMALEPYARRHWPWTIISYSRLVAGRLRDPLMGRDVLIGLLVGLTNNLLQVGHGFHASLLGYRPSTSTWTDVFLGPRHLLAQITHQVTFALWVGLIGLVMILVLRPLCRKQWLAVVLGCLFLTLAYVPTRPTGPPGLVAPYLVAVFALWFWALLRFGVVVGSFAPVALNARFLPLTTNLSAWYAPLGWLGLAGLLGVAVYGFWAALGGRKLLGEDLLGG